MKLEEGIVEIKKECIYEKDVRSKVLTINVMSSHSKKRYEMLTELKINGIKHVSLKHATTEERLAAIHCNEITYFKARHDTLFNVRKRQLIKTKNETKSVEQLIENVQANKADLFLDIEQGSSKFINDIHVFMNPIRK